MCGTTGVNIKPGRWRSPVSPRRPGFRAINQALCHGWTGTGPVCFQGCRRHWPGYLSSVVSLLSLCSSRREGAGTLRSCLIVSEGHGYPLVLANRNNFFLAYLLFLLYLLPRACSIVANLLSGCHILRKFIDTTSHFRFSSTILHFRPLSTPSSFAH